MSVETAKAKVRDDDATILYHYTSTAGLKGILHDGRIWMTDIRFLNDSQEFTLARKLLDRVLDEVDSETPSELRAALVKEVRRDSRLGERRPFGRARPSVYVFCLSQSQDQLSQWRGYCPEGGYSIGFRRAQLSEFCNDADLQLVKCEYDEAKQLRTIRELFDRFGSELDSGRGGGSRVISATERFVSEFVNLAPSLKGAAFHEEKEFRVVAVSSHEPRRPDGFVVRRGIAVPFLEVDISTKGGLLGEVWVGPPSQRDLSEASVDALLRARLPQNVRHYTTVIRHTTIPFRP